MGVAVGAQKRHKQAKNPACKKSQGQAAIMRERVMIARHSSGREGLHVRCGIGSAEVVLSGRILGALGVNLAQVYQVVAVRGAGREATPA